MPKKQLSRNLRKALRKTVSYLPAPIRYRIIRQSLRLDYSRPESLEFKVADNLEELKAAYRILHDTYVEQGYSVPCESGMRITKYFSLPTTSTLIAKLEGQVVGTMSIIRKSQFGLPLEQEFDLSKLEKNGDVIAEVSSLAIDKGFLGNRGSLFLPLCKFFYEYALRYMNLDYAVIVVNPIWRDFYKGILGFQDLANKEVSKYEFANGAPGVGLKLNIKKEESILLELYGEIEKKKNLYTYMVEHKMNCFQFPDRTYAKAQDPVMTPEMLSYFFSEKSDIYKNLTPLEVLTLHSLYPQKQYKLVLPQMDTTPKNTFHRQGQRYIIQAHGEILNKKELCNIRIIDASREGVRVYGKVRMNEQVDLKVFISENEEVNLSGTVCWIDKNSSTFGVRLTESGETWESYIDYLNSDFSKLIEKKAAS
jgi:hypothetical protein